jgi:hypothetical protein
MTHAGMQHALSHQQRQAAIPSQPRAPTAQVRQPPPVVRHRTVRQPVEAKSPSPQVPSKDRDLYGKSPRVSDVELTHGMRDRARAGERVAREPALALQEVEDDCRVRCKWCFREGPLKGIEWWVLITIDFSGISCLCIM